MNECTTSDSLVIISQQQSNWIELTNAWDSKGKKKQLTEWTEQITLTFYLATIRFHTEIIRNWQSEFLQVNHREKKWFQLSNGCSNPRSNQWITTIDFDDNWRSNILFPAIDLPKVCKHGWMGHRGKRFNSFFIHSTYFVEWSADVLIIFIYILPFV